MAIYSAVACLLFLLLYIISSSLNTVNTLNSITQIAILTTSIFIFFLSTGLTLKKKYIFTFLFVVSLGSVALYSIHSLLFPLPFMTHHDFQFILPTASGHNHLGDLVVLGLISSLFLTSSIPLIAIQVIFLIVVGLSFSKSALIGLVFVAFFLTLTKKKYGLFFIGITLIASLLIGVYSQESVPFHPVGNIQKTIQKALHINPKPLLSSREKYISQILKPWVSTPLEHIFFGYGPGNFSYASNRAAQSRWDVVTDTHNLLLMFFIESGLLPTLWFIIFVGVIFYNGYKTHTPLLFLALYLFIHFQMDYTYRIPFFIYLFFFLCGQIAPIPTKSVSMFSHKNILILLSFCIMVFFNVTKTSLIQQHKDLTKQLDTGIQSKDKKMFVSAAQKLERMTPYETDLLLTLASFYESFGENKESVRLLDKLYTYSPRDYFVNLAHLMKLQKTAKIDTKNYLEQKEKQFMTFPFNGKEKSNLDHICREYLERECLCAFPCRYDK